MPVAAPLIIAGGSIASGLIGANAAKSAANAQLEAENNALSFQKSIFDKTQANFEPYLNVGRGATYSLGQLYGIGKDGNSIPANADYSQFYNSPDYDFAKQQGELGLTRAENARGMNLSGGALKDIADYNQGLASQQFGNYFNRLLSLSQLGNNAAAAAGNSGANFSNQIGNTMGAMGQSQASGIVGGANAITGGINSGITNSLLYNALNRSSYSPPGSSAITSPLGYSNFQFGGASAPLGTGIWPA